MPAAPTLNGNWFISLGILPPPLPEPSGSPPCTTQSSTRWNLRPSYLWSRAFCTKFATVLGAASARSVIVKEPPLASSTIARFAMPVAWEGDGCCATVHDRIKKRAPASAEALLIRCDPWRYYAYRLRDALGRTCSKQELQ